MPEKKPTRSNPFANGIPRPKTPPVTPAAKAECNCSRADKKNAKK